MLPLLVIVVAAVVSVDRMLAPALTAMVPELISVLLLPVALKR